MGKLDVTFSEFSSTRVASFKADIVSVTENEPPPIYYLIIGIESLANMGIILDFVGQKLTIDHVTLPMKPHNQFMKFVDLQAQFLTVPQKLISTHSATKHTLEILDAKYEKADIAKFVAQNCKHLSISEQNLLINLLLKFEDLFGDFLDY